MSTSDIRQEVINGILCGAREAAANLFRVANGGDHGCRDRARNGRKDIKRTSVMMLELVEEVFATEGES
ncbi:hypothetical protein [Bradyrhizobium neotropicale]|uniref:hypothetical protein n=1 Tax=Bradyrhizobium neotropicale TaxID=1497615 RepID=UPI001AD6B044|nr:hypothetical protein [Bradyrhizobium neotropicale]MBO4228377.1 hypothetical protein [Bradyrhizobium neotropicale]